nr:MAG TPA: hypothetical protein [Herelleviridae sp.]
MRILYLKFLPLLCTTKAGTLFITYKRYFYHKYLVINYLTPGHFGNSIFTIPALKLAF